MSAQSWSKTEFKCINGAGESAVASWFSLGVQQWGIGSTSSVTFPVAFASSMYAASAGQWCRDSESYLGADQIAWTTSTTTQIKFINAENSSYRKTYWIAVGKQRNGVIMVQWVKKQLL